MSFHIYDASFKILGTQQANQYLDPHIVVDDFD